MTRYEEETRFLHGGDYNPDQWLAYPEVLKQDLLLMQQAHTNTFSLGIFAWSALEPTEGQFEFAWLDQVMDDIAAFGGNVILATPSGARPAWMAEAYPEVLRTSEKREKCLQGGRHNHCFTSPVYREKVAIINQKLAQRYHDHPALLMWHLSNEYSGECHCELCQTAFRHWLKAKYDTLDALNHAWWGAFWSHTYTSWEQIQSPSPLGETMVHGLNLDWKRFVTDQTIDFYLHEVNAIKIYSSTIPVTTNFMADTADLLPFQSLNYGEFAKHVDIVSWDCYPAWHNDWETTASLASKVGFINDQYRSLKQQPFLIMESTPSGVNWHEFNKTKRPGMHQLSSLQFIAHGSDSNLYFQWRKSRGSSEKFHGAVVDHDGSTNNRVFQDVATVGKQLEKIKEIKGSHKQARVAILYDWENNWALEDAQGFGLSTKRYPQTLQEHYRVFWEADIAVDIITPDHDLSHYSLVIAPMLYLITNKTIQTLQRFVANGGKLVGTYLTGCVNEYDLTYLGGWPKELAELFGIQVLETDTYYPTQRNEVVFCNQLFETKDYQTRIQLDTAATLGTYTQDFYAQEPACTVNDYQQGTAYFIGARTEPRFLKEFYALLIRECQLKNPFILESSPVVSVQTRENEEAIYVFLLNFSEQPSDVTLMKSGYELLSSREIDKKVSLAPYETKVIKYPRT